MQADLFTGLLMNQKLSGKEYIGLKETHKTSRSDNPSDSSDSKNFLEIISKLVDEADKSGLKNEEKFDALRKLLGDDFSQFFLSEILPRSESLDHPIDYEKGGDLLLAFQKMIGFDPNCSDSSEVILKENKELEEAFALQNSENQAQFFDEKSNFATGQKKNENSILEMSQSVDKKMSSNESIDIELEKNLEKEKSDQGDDTKLDSSTSKKNVPNFSDLFDENKQHTKDKQSILEDKKNPIQKLGLNSSDKDRDNILSRLLVETTSSTSETDEQNKNIGLSKANDNPKVSGVVAEENNGEKLKPLLTEIKSSFNHLNSNSNGDSTGKFISDKLSSNIAETKVFSQPTQLNQSEIIQQIVEKAKLRVTKDHNEISIKLKPEILGNIRLNISTENHHVTIKVMADSTTVKEILENNLHLLRNGFVHQGLEIGSFDVMVGDQPQNFYNGQNFSGFQRGRRRTDESKRFVLNNVEESEELGISTPHRSEFEKERIDYYA